ncbi:unnamed protein product [Clonostachys byssicola]|uniref:PD-(D/E)XK nuclease-like domain-containing protein n=1 Tax=Clonostachys byssicola TaxID=160290 RepID=A0A9N9U3R8_9HYPO|nr:unnamed protein product [Clonostachys byssicola]
MSDSDTTESPPNKRLRLNTESECSESSTSYCRRSRTASPTRHLVLFQANHVIDRQSFTGEKQRPKRLDDLVNLIKNDAIGMGILTQPDWHSIRAYSEQHPDERVLLSDLLNTQRLIDTTGERTNLGVMPPIADLVEIWREANTCEVNGHSEAAWNSEVHSPLLKAALRYSVVNQPGDPRPVKIAHTNMTTAQIIECYSLYQRTKPEKRADRVDFCFYLQPKSQPTKGALSSAAQRSVHGSINHTDYIALLNRPISLSIKTDRKAGLEHMSVWLSAHWDRLDELGADKERLLERAMFLPGIIVQGHTWALVAATQGALLRDRGETIIWTQIPIGSTEGLQGICQIITVLQRLAVWSTDTYWPWLANLTHCQCST